MKEQSGTAAIVTSTAEYYFFFFTYVHHLFDVFRDGVRVEAWSHPWPPFGNHRGLHWGYRLEWDRKKKTDTETVNLKDHMNGVSFWAVSWKLVEEKKKHCNLLCYAFTCNTQTQASEGVRRTFIRNKAHTQSERDNDQPPVSTSDLFLWFSLKRVCTEEEHAVHCTHTAEGYSLSRSSSLTRSRHLPWNAISIQCKRTHIWSQRGPNESDFNIWFHYVCWFHDWRDTYCHIIYKYVCKSQGKKLKKIENRWRIQQLILR